MLPLAPTWGWPSVRLETSRGSSQGVGWRGVSEVLKGSIGRSGRCALMEDIRKLGQVWGCLIHSPRVSELRAFYLYFLQLAVST